MGSAAYALLGTLGPRDVFVTVSLPVFWLPENIGINGRFLSGARPLEDFKSAIDAELALKKDTKEAA